MTSLTIENGLLARVAVNFWSYLLSQPMTYFRVADRFVVGLFVGVNGERLALVYSDDLPQSPTSPQLMEILGRAAHYRTRRIYKPHQLPFLIETLRRVQAMYIITAHSLDGTPVTLIFPRCELSAEATDYTFGFYGENNFSSLEISRLIAESPVHRTLYVGWLGGRLNVGFVARDHEVVMLHGDCSVQIENRAIQLVSPWLDTAAVS